MRRSLSGSNCRCGPLARAAVLVPLMGAATGGRTVKGAPGCAGPWAVAFMGGPPSKGSPPVMWLVELQLERTRAKGTKHKAKGRPGQDGHAPGGDPALVV